MASVLVTGASGLIGSALVARLEDGGHEVVALSRSPASAAVAIRGDFASSEDLRALDSHRFDVAVHLAAVLYGASEEECMAVNLEGSRTLLRYLVESGCHRFVVASSIAATGCMGAEFAPRQVPIPDDHPCDAADPYGLSKWLMEEFCFYLCRAVPELEVSLLRIGGVVEAATTLDNVTLDERLIDWESHPFLIGGGMVAQADVVEVCTRAVERPLGPGARRFNLVGATSVAPLSSAEALERMLARRRAELALDFYRAVDNERASFYATERIQEAFGLRPATGLDP